jgi:D-lyxose ketol-isomerase
MKRSELNGIISDAIDFMNSMNFKLPPFALWSPRDWAGKGAEYNEIRDNMLGWDITDFGHGRFEQLGLLLFTIRNGKRRSRTYSKPYAEKLLFVREEQITPFHFHWKKMEDIINRGGGNLLVTLYNSTSAGAFARSPVEVAVDGRNYRVKAGTTIALAPGESISLRPGQYHRFWGEKGAGEVLVGEVSAVNDDQADNRFHETMARFPRIEKDTAPRFLLCNEYPPANRAEACNDKR